MCNLKIIPFNEVMNYKKKSSRLIRLINNGISDLGLFSMNQLIKFETSCILEYECDMTSHARKQLLKAQLVKIEKIKHEFNDLKIEKNKLKEFLQYAALSNLEMTKDQLNKHLNNSLPSETFKSLKLIIAVLNRIEQKISTNLDQIKNIMKKYKIEDIQKLTEDIEIIKEDMLLYQITGRENEAQIEREREKKLLFLKIC